jgi:hypothetical protein
MASGRRKIPALVGAAAVEVGDAVNGVTTSAIAANQGNIAASKTTGVTIVMKDGATLKNNGADVRIIAANPASQAENPRLTILNWNRSMNQCVTRRPPRKCRRRSANHRLSRRP